MELILIAIFVLGYAAIAFEHPLKINKTAPALLIGALMWAIWALVDHQHIDHISSELNLELASIAQILFFLLGAMTIVELIDKVLMNHTNEAIIEEVADAVNEMMSERAIFVF